MRIDVRNDKSRDWQKLLLVSVAVLMVLSLPARATTILSMEIDSLANDAEFIFEGRVVDRQALLDSATGIIHTYVTFSVDDIVKGEYGGDLLELKFTGGEYNGQIVQVSGLRIPQLGEEGIYFLESISQDLINPILGWSQGHFIVVEENGERVVNTADKTPVTDIQSMANVPAAIKKPLDLIEGNSDSAAGVVTRVDAISAQPAMTADEFKSRISELIGN